LEIHLPTEGQAPYPVVLLLHGCAGPRPEFQRQWARVATQAGYAAIIIDSTGPRGLSRKQALEKVCAGKQLFGQERAGDIPATLFTLQKDPRLDLSQLVLSGWSHGAWTVMDYLTMRDHGDPSSGLKSFDYVTPKIDGVILFYPYCGIGSLSRFRKWNQTPPTLALIAGGDTIVDAQQCIAFFNKTSAKGVPVNVTVYPGAEHVFDDPFLEPDYIDWYNEAFLEDAKKRYSAFLDNVALDNVAVVSPQ
jgi:dienelactone hydrolase